MPEAREGTIREGCVVVPVKERTFGRGGRLKLKAVGATYLSLK